MSNNLNLILNEAFDWSLSPQELREIYKQTKFDSFFFKSIAKDVILTLSPQQPAEDQVHRHLIEPLERFVCNLNMDATSEEVAESLQNIQSLSQPNKLCRRTLKPGDVIFSCNDCGYDDTCVVCLDCFHKSAHKDHNYRMSNSDGGGCCDCGDFEAWKEHYACTDHLNSNQPNPTLSDFEDKNLRSQQISLDKKSLLEHIRRLPPSIATNYFIACQACLNYAQLILTWEDHSILPENLAPTITGDSELEKFMSEHYATKNSFTVVLNDEIHTYDHVINTLVKVIKCTKLTASIMASTISREGRSLIVNDTYEACHKVRDMIVNVRDAGQNPLKVQVVHGTILAHQAFALKLLEWVRKMSALCDAFRVLTAYTLLGTTELTLNEVPTSSSRTLVEHVMLSNTNYWKIARVEWNELLVATMISDYSIKEYFARLMTRNYPKLVRDFILDDHDHSVSILILTTQIYTVPSLTCMLIEEENALSIVAATLIDTCKSSKRDNYPTSFENRNTFDILGLKRGLYVISDLRHLISIQPTKWTEQLRKNSIESVQVFLNLLSSMQGMDSVKRQLGQHLEYEPDWESGMNLQNRLINFISRLVTFCSYDEDVLLETLKETQTRLLANGSFKMIGKELFGHKVNCIQYDVSTSPVSIHLPLTRFAAALILELMKRRPSEKFPYDEALVVLVERGEARSRYSMIDIMEQSLRTEVMIAQFRSGMWRRNGYSLVNQILYFHGPIMRKEMFDRDILVLQECAAMTQANQFMIHLLNKFQLFTWVVSETTREPLVGPKAVSFHNDEDIMTQTMSMGEEFLQLLLTIISERYTVGVGLIEEEDAMKNEIIQLLCISPSTRSEVTRKLAVNDNELDCIKSVANLKRSNEASSGKYELKEEYYDRFNPFFYHYSRRHQSNALAAQLKRKKNLRGSLVCCPPPVPVELTKQFRNLNELLKCDITLILIGKILTRSLGIPDDSQECSTKAPIRFFASDLQLDQVLHLIGLGLHEQGRYLMDFNYIKAAFDKDIFRLLRECYEKTKRSRDLIFWIMKKTYELIETLSTNGNSSIDPDTLHALETIKEYFSPALSTCDTMKQDKKKRNSEMAARHQSRIMAMMRANQNKFLSNPTTKQLIDETEKMDSQNIDTDPTNQPDVIREPSHLCILCREEQTISFEQPQMVLLAFVQRSSVLSQNRSERRIPNYALTPTNQIKLNPSAQSYSESGNSPDVYSFTSDNSWSFNATFMTSDLFFGPHISTCGHAMHLECWDGFFDAAIKRETSRPNRSARHVSYELERQEILCPLCECISNATIPLLPNYTNFAQRPRLANQVGTIFASSPEILNSSPEKLSACLHALRGTVHMFKHIRHINKSLINHDNKYMRLLRPDCINDVLEELDEMEALSLRDFINSTRSDKILARDCSLGLLSSISTLAERIYIVGLDLDKSMTDVHHARVFMMTSWCVSYTIQSYERLSRLKKTSLFEEVESSKNLCLRSLLRFACSSMLTHQSDMMQCLLVRKLRYLLINDVHLSSSPCCLDIDAFETFVSIFILLQKLYSHIDDSYQLSGNNKSSSEAASSASTEKLVWASRAFDHEYFRNVLHLMVVLNMLQLIVSHHNDSTDHQPAASSSADQQIPTSEQMVLENFYKEIVIASGHPISKVPAVDGSMVIKMKHGLLPFLRSCAIFFYHLSDILPPEDLRAKSSANLATVVSNQVPATIDEDATNKEFIAICQYLVLPSDFGKLLQSQEARNLACSWLRHPRVQLLIKSALVKNESDPNLSTAASTTTTTSSISSTELMPVKFIRQPHPVNRLVDLPYEYSELLDKAFRLVCASEKNTCATSTMCLVCGVMLCSQCYSCQRDLNGLASNYQVVCQQQSQRSDATSRRASVGPVRRLTSSPINISTENERSRQNTTRSHLEPIRSPSEAAASSSSGSSSSTIHQQLVGSCTYHAYECSAGVGLFLRVRNCQILLLSGRSKGCYMPAPYIDDHGETDFGLLRGNPLHLNYQHYEKLQHMWLNHSIPEQISRTLEYSPYASSINWHLH